MAVEITKLPSTIKSSAAWREERAEIVEARMVEAFVEGVVMAFLFAGL
jgi:hypothetical protein